MQYLFKKVKIIDPESTWHNKVLDVLVENGIVKQIASNLKTSMKNAIILEEKGSCLSLGWVDIGCISGEPGNEHRETLSSLSKAAASGGYTHVCCMPNTKPALHSKAEIQYIRSKTEKLEIDILPIGALSKDLNGSEMTEMIQMHENGAVAFSDGISSIKNNGFLLRALMYANNIDNGLVIETAHDQGLAPAGQMNEGKLSTYLGLRGIPNIAEYIAVYRNIELLKYAQSKLLIHKISCPESIALIKKNKSSLPNLFASVSIFNLAFDEDQLNSFNVHFKLQPPLRNKEEKKQLLKALTDQTIDIIVSDHTPWDPEKKDLEFQQAAFGSISVETAFANFMGIATAEVNEEIWVEKVAINPRKIFKLSPSKIEIGTSADLCWFNPNKNWTYKENKVNSLAKNSPFINTELKGAVNAIFTKNNLIWNQHLDSSN